MSFTYICDYCGGEAIKTQRIPGKCKHVYCSSICYHKAQVKKKETICLNCGSTFMPQGATARQYCSRKCYLEHSANRVTKTCKVCGKEFSVWKTYDKRYTVCSIECSKNKPIYYTCLTCGETYMGGTKKTKFCSFSCYRSYNGETSIEKRVRETLWAMCLKNYVQEWQELRYSLDFAFPDYSIAIEVDGMYWHQDPAKELQREQVLCRLGWSTIHITEDEINERDEYELAELIRYRIKWVNPELLTWMIDCKL